MDPEAQKQPEQFGRARKGTGDYPHIPGKHGLEALACCFGFFLFITSIPLMFIFVYGLLPKSVCVLTILMTLSGLIPVIAHDGNLVKSTDSAGPLLSMLITVCCLLAAAAGLHAYYKHVQPTEALQLLRDYENVYPQQPAQAFYDAGFIEFSSNTKVDTAKGATFKTLESGLFTFCAAPIVTAENAGRAEFWAVGVDCCGDAGEFECGDAGEAGARRGWVMVDPAREDILYERIGKYIAPPETRQDLFKKAMHKAEGMHGMIASEAPVLVLWTNKAKGEIIREGNWSIAITCIAYILSGGFLAMALTAFWERCYHVKHLHDRLQHQGVQYHHPSRHAARILEFFEHTLAMDKVPLPPIKAEDVCLASVVLPYLVLMLCLVISSFAYCSRFGNIIILPIAGMLLILIGALLTTPNRTTQGLLVLIVAIVGTYIGCLNWDNNVYHYCQVESHRKYTNVFPDADAVEYEDAGKFLFQESAKIYNNWSVGFKYNDAMYCVAPVIRGDLCVEDDDGSRSQSVCVQKNTLGQCVNCLTSDQCTVGRHCDPFMKKCVAAITDSCDAPIANCQPHCPDNATVSECTCTNVDFPSKWQNPTCTDEDASGDSATDATSLVQLKAMRSRRQFNLMNQESQNHLALEDTAAGSSQDALTEKKCTPVVPSRVDFWAVGKDCCKPSGDFWCSDTEDTDAKSAAVVYAFDGQNSDKLDPWKMYHRAVLKSTDNFGLPFPEKPMLVKWGTDADKMSSEWMEKATGIVVLTAVSGLLVILAIGLLSFLAAKRQRKAESRERMQRQQERGFPSGQ